MQLTRSWRWIPSMTAVTALLVLVTACGTGTTSPVPTLRPTSQAAAVVPTTGAAVPTPSKAPSITDTPPRAATQTPLLPTIAPTATTLAATPTTGAPAIGPTSRATGVSGAGPRLSIVATTTQIRSLAEAVAGDSAMVRSLLPPGADPHEFEPRPSDVQAITQSQLVLKNGIGLDDWLDKLIQNAGGQRPVVTVTDGIKVRKGDEADKAGDPHAWFDVMNAMTMTRNIRDALSKADPRNAPTYNAQADAYLKRLTDLDTYIRDQIAGVPPDQRKMVTNHDAFGYYIDRYGLTYVGSVIPSLSTEAQPSAKDVAELIQKIKAEHVKAIFLESSINPQLAQQIGRDAGVKVVDTLYGDALGEPGTPGATYESMMRYNTDTIVSALK